MTYTVGCDGEGRPDSRCGPGSSATPAPTPASATRCSSAPPAMPAAPTGSRPSTSRRAPCTPTTRRAARCAVSARTRPTSRIEGMLDRLAERVGIDGWDIRWRTPLDVGDIFGTGQRLGPGVGLRKTLLAVRDDYKAARLRRHRLRGQEHRHRQRIDRVRQGGHPARGTTARSPSTSRGPRWARASSPCSARSPASSSALTPDRVPSRSTPSASLTAARRPPPAARCSAAGR